VEYHSPEITQLEMPQKALRVFGNDAREPAQLSTDPEREHYISKFTNEDGLSRDVATAKYDFFT
jgi:hypothetical protein